MSLDTLWAMLGANTGFHLIRSKHGHHWVAVDSRRRFMAIIDRFAYDGDLTVTAVPRPDHGAYRLVGRSACLWVCCETPDSVFRLRGFAPPPTLTIHEGASRRTALWALARPLDPEWTERANKRLAHRLRCPKKHGSPHFELHVPGTVLRAGRKRPVPVVLEAVTDRLYDARRVVGGLPDAPDPDAWRTTASS